MSLYALNSMGFGGKGLDQDLAKVLAELQGLSFALVDGANANTTIAVTGMETEDTIKMILNLTDLAAVDLAHVTINERRAKGTIQIDTDLADGDTVVVGGKTYTFDAVADPDSICYNPAPQIVPFVAGDDFDAEVVAAKLAQVIMSSDSRFVCTVSTDTVTVFYRTAGTAGNAITLTEVGGGVNLSGALFTGGLATTSCGFQCSDSTASKKLLVVWYNKQ